MFGVIASAFFLATLFAGAAVILLSIGEDWDKMRAALAGAAAPNRPHAARAVVRVSRRQAAPFLRSASARIARLRAAA